MKNKEAKSIFSSLEHFSSTPPPELWGKIEAQLDKPKKKKRPVVWWWVAAGLMIGFSLTTILNVNSNQENNLELNIDNNTNGVVLQNKSKNDIETNKVKNTNTIENELVESNSINGNILDETIVLQNKSKHDIEANELKNKNVENELVNSNSLKRNVSNETNTNGIVLQNKSKQIIESNKVKNNNAIENGIAESNDAKANVLNKTNTKNVIDKKTTISTKSNSAVVATSAVSPATANSKKSTASFVTGNAVATTVAAAKSNAKFVNSNKNQHNNQSIAVIGNDSQSNALVINKNTSSNTNKTASANEINNSNQKNNSDQINVNGQSTGSKNTAVAGVKQNKGNSEDAHFKATVNDKNTITELNSNKSIADNSKNKDSVKIKKEIAQLTALAELEKDKTKKEKKSEVAVIDKWSLQVFAGVMSSDNFTNEKALGNTVASKQSSGYGVKTNYKLNKKWAVSSGFKINELGQKIAGVSYYERSGMFSPTTGLIPEEAFGPSTDNSSKSNPIVFASNNKNYLFAADAKATSTASGFETGNVTQNLRYFEMPIEISYAILSKKKTNIIMNTGGFVGKLISNEMLLDGNSIGENNNVNEYVYGTVLSSTLQYEFYKKTKFFIEPGMNYYVNPLENQSFNQFQWVFNVGINVSF